MFSQVSVTSPLDRTPTEPCPLGPYPYWHLLAETTYTVLLESILVSWIRLYVEWLMIFEKSDSTYFMLSGVQYTLKPSSFCMSEVIMPPFEQFNSFTQRLTLPPLSPHDEGFAMQASGSCPRSTYWLDSRLVSIPPQTCMKHFSEILIILR